MRKSQDDGVDMSQVYRFLEETAPLIAPIKRAPVSIKPFLIGLAIVVLVILCIYFP